MNPQVCTLDEVSPILTQFVEESVQKFEIKAQSLKQRDCCGRSYNKEFRLKTDQKFSFKVSIWVDCNEHNQYDISTLAGKVSVWTPEFQSDIHGRQGNIPADRVIEIVKMTQSLAEIYAPIFKQNEVPLGNLSYY